MADWTVHISMAHFGRFERALGNRFRMYLAIALAKAGSAGRKTLRDETVARGIRFRGQVARGWTFRQDSWRQLTFYNHAPHTVYVEGGRRPGARQPPSSALIPWVKRRMGVKDDRAAASLAYVIARAIGRRGIAARPVLSSPEMRDRLAEQIVRTIFEVMERALVTEAARAAR